MLRIGIVGLGYWGPNLVRCFSDLTNCQVVAVCDRRTDQLARIQSRYPNVSTVTDFDDMLANEKLGAVVLATPTKSHYELALKALRNDLHVFVEKPLAETSAQCRHLVEVAQERNLVLFVGHVFLHSAPVLKLRELVENGELGKINYISSRRLNLGPVRSDVNALYDLAPHDISIMIQLLGSKPHTVTCTGCDPLQAGIHDVCSLSMLFPDGRMGIVHVSWLDPRKERVITVVGDQKMAVYDDLEQEKIKVYDKGVEQPRSSTGDYADFLFSYRHGGSYSPFLAESEPLKVECGDFVRCILDGELPVTDGKNGLEVVEVLEAAQRSLRNDGQPVTLESLQNKEVVGVG